MSKMIFVNLPVTDLDRSKAFYAAIGAANNPAFSGDNAACMVFSETIYAMLHTEPSWRRFTPKDIPDTHRAAQVLLCLSEDSKADVLARLGAAVAAGGKADPTPEQDYGVMYGRSFEDPDGHIWEVMWMDPVAAEAGAEAIEENVG